MAAALQSVTIRLMRRIALLLLLAASAAAQDRVSSVTYGDVPATLVTPARSTGRGPAIIFVHWGLGDRHGFLTEARLLARYGVVSLLIDAPFARKSGAPAEEWRQVQECVNDVQHGVDFLRARSDVDPARIGFVGLSFGAHIGAILTAAEPRLRAFVLMGGLASNSAENPNAPQEEKDLDAETWIAKPHSAAVFLQFALHDEYISRAQADRFADAAAGAIVKWYEGGHEFNAAARDDRLQWLSGELGFTIGDPMYHHVAAEPSPGFAGTKYAELSKVGLVLEIPGMESIPVRRDIAWKPSLKMDVYYPFGMDAEPKLRIPAIILVSGQLAPQLMPKVRQMRFVTTAAQAIAARANRAVIVYDIRPAGEHDETLADVEKDLDDLIAYVRGHADELQIDGDSLAILARSAGGSYGIHGAWSGARPWIKAVALQYVDVAPATELAKDGAKPPLLLVTAAHDPFYNAGAVAALKAEAKKQGTSVEQIHLADGDHGFDIVDDTEASRDAMRQTILWLRARLPIGKR
jgi:dienelactone hydrolase